MDIGFLVKLTSRAWSLTILALMHGGVSGRQAQLIAASGAGRTALTQSLKHLVDMGLMERNPGHGHPLRPEYRLTATGASVAPLADAIIRLASADEKRCLLRRAWTVPILAATRTSRYYREIRAVLAPITDRALSGSLKAVEKVGWLTRRVEETARPPRPVYQSTNVGKQISNICKEALEV